MLHHPYPNQAFGSRKEMFNHQLKGDLAKHYKHIKSNSEAMNKLNQDFEESRTDSVAQVYTNKRALKLHNYSPEKIIPPITHDENHEQNLIIFSKDFNTVKYSQSPFLNKLTSLKQKITNKEKATVKYNKGHKSRNSMFPKSYTEDTNFQRREADIYTKLNLRNPGFDRIPEEPMFKTYEDNKHNNPYTNIDVEHDIISAYGNDHVNQNDNVVFRNLDKKKVRIGSDKKRAPTDTTRSKTGIDASNDSGKATPQVNRPNDSNESNKRSIPVSADKRGKPIYPQTRKNRQPSDYYQLDKDARDPKRKGEIISILSMEIGESEGLSHSYSHQDEKAQLCKGNSKKDLERILGVNHFENQKTLKQNMKYLKDQ